MESINSLIPLNTIFDRTFIMLARASFYPTLLYTVIMKKVSSRNWYDRIDDNVILGALPLKKLSQTLINEENVKGVVSMNEDYELALFANGKSEWKEYGIEFLQLKTRDVFETPSQEKLEKGIKFIKDIIEKSDKKGSVYVHCKAGRTRSATLVGCYIMEKTGCDAATAVEIMKEKRPHILLRKPQLRALNTYHDEMVSKRSNTI